MLEPLRPILLPDNALLTQIEINKNDQYIKNDRKKQYMLTS